MNDKIREVLEKIKSCYEQNVNRQTEKLDDIPLLVNRALEALSSNPWQPIETAPKDKPLWVIWSNDYQAVAWFESIAAKWNDGDEYTHMIPTHWMPLPNPPGKVVNK